MAADVVAAPAPRVRTLPMPHVDGVRHRHVTVGGARLHVAEAGTGPPVVLIHGWPQHWFCWRAVIGPLSERFRVLCPDIRGLGWSDGPGRDWSLQRLGADVLGLLDHEGIERAPIVGHDWGATIAYKLALERPDRVERVATLAILHPWSAIGGRLRAALRPWHIPALAAAAGPLNRHVPEHALRTWRHAGAFSPAEVAIFTAQMRLPGTVAATRLYYRNLMLREVPRFVAQAPRLRLRVPALHLDGAHDPLTRHAPDSWRHYADDMRHERIADCGHFVAEERPDVLVDRLLGFL